MDQTAIVTSIVIISISTIIVIISKLATKRRAYRLSKQIKEFAQSLGFDLSEFEFIHDRGIGIDRTNHKLFFVQESRQIKDCIDLKHLSKSSMNEESRTVSTGKESARVVERLEMVLLSKDRQAIVARLLFYNALDKDYALNGEHEFIYKWTQLINEHLLRLNTK